MGQGVDVAIAQIIAEELDAEVDQAQVIMGDSVLRLNQGGALGSTAIEQGARPLSAAAAEARRVLLELAAIANAIFDASGIRMRRAPFIPERVKGTLDAALT